MSTNVPKFLAVATVVVAMMSASDTRAGALKKGIVIRGIAPTLTCSVANVVPEHNRNEEGQVSNLSVNCTDKTDNIGNYATYARSLPNTKFCVAQITQIVRNNGMVNTDPIQGNKLHCLIDKIMAKKLVSLMTEMP